MRGGGGAQSRPIPSNPQRALTAKDIKVIMNTSDGGEEKVEILTRKDSTMGRKDKVQMMENDASQMTKSKKIKVKLIRRMNLKYFLLLPGVDVFDAKAVVSMDVCVRSNSVDSLRTTGHSRSVSHDSYFDLLQSPLRGIVNCPSRELSELGINFDREEPEMRLFSDSESLVSSPRIPKDHQANAGGGGSASGTGHSSRRVLRSRPEEFSNTTSSINPSPKKQPRLNIQSSSGRGGSMAEGGNTWGPMSMDESIMCKRYKLEDQLSDIQFIDCNTPEHQIGVHVNRTPFSSSSSLSASYNAMTKFNTNAQVHAPPAIVIKKTKESEGPKSPLNRFSYPQYVAVNQSYQQQPQLHKVQIRQNDSGKKDGDRFSYPGEQHMRKNRRYGYQEEDVDDQSDSLVKSVMDHFTHFNRTDQPVKALSADPSQQSLQTIVTPSSPSHSLRYSLLASGTGDTSSENCSETGSVGCLLKPNPANEMETSVTSSTRLIDHQRGAVVDVKCGRDQHMVVSEDEIVDEHTRDPNNEGDVIHDLDLEKTFVDISALKRKFSLDLMAESPPGRSEIDKAQKTLDLSTPNTPNHTQNSGGATTTSPSQSVTPSEFGYQQLNRISNPCTPATPQATDFIIGQEVTPPKLMLANQGVKGSSVTAAGSPIKSTICITYNTKSPATTPPRSCGPVLRSLPGADTCDDYEVIEVDSTGSGSNKEAESSMLETSFDENMVYEQVKFFKSAVSAINNLVEGGDSETTPISEEIRTPRAAESAVQIVPNMTTKEIYTVMEQNVARRLSKGGDVAMGEAPPAELNDSLEFDNNNASLYENVNVEKPAAVYENMDVRRAMVEAVEKELAVPELTVEVKVEQQQQQEEDEMRPKGKFLVKQLATKFETSPVDPQPPFEFGGKSAALMLRRDTSSGAVCNRMTAPASGPVMVMKNGSNPRAIARSLDENAFVREFGSVKIPNIGDQQENNQNSENVNGAARRSGGSDYAKPKSLNPPKKLPLLDNATVSQQQPQPSVETKSCRVAAVVTIRSKEDPMSKSSPYLAQKITPTTENKILLVQSTEKSRADVLDSGEEKNSGVGGNSVQLRDCKLDRDRIERIKEERRLQLNEKFRSESFKGENDTIKFKSKSKSELRASEKGDAILHGANTLDRTLRSRSKVEVGRREKEEVEKQQQLSGNNNRSEEQLSWIGGGERRSVLIQDRIRRVSEGKGAVEDGREATATNANWKLRNSFEKRNSGISIGQVTVMAREREGSVEGIIQRNMEQQ